MSDADQLEDMLRGIGPVRWSREPELVLQLETRISSVSFVFDGAERLVKVETPEDAAEPEPEPSAELDEKGKAKIEILECISAARKLILSREARDKLDRAVDLLGAL